LEAYCLKCKQKREMINPVATYTVRGAPLTKGECAVCGTTIIKMGLTEAHAGLEKPSLPPEAKTSNKEAKAKSKRKKSTLKQVSSGKELVIVESPTKAKTIGKFLGKDYNVIASAGHVRDLLKSQLSVDVDNNFAPKYRVPNDKLPIVKEIAELAEQSPKVYLATDRTGKANRLPGI